MRKQILILTLITVFFSCNNSSKKRVAISQIKADVTIDRFDVDFYTSDSTTLSKVKSKYPLFFPKGNHDSIWLRKIKEEKELFIETQKKYTDIDFLKKRLEDLFKHIKYYDTTFIPPKVVTLLNSVDFENRVVYNGTFLLISLDVFLGKEHPFYGDYPVYIKNNFTKERIIVDAANSIIKQTVRVSKNRLFLYKMIDAGKKLYLLDMYLPQVIDEVKIGYPKEKLNWAIANEAQIWKYFIENKLLFSTDIKLNKRFLDLAPFSKFYRSEDNLSPGRIGTWMGWQIVRAYMENNTVSLQELVEMPAEEIFKKSLYKPKK
ncbi:MAG: gliding motility lipoprotein GldB [Flavobacteriaceae bacterium]|nr:gliding motility lipoprotein GldB [Flavobacteriaceae bacterium]